MSSITTGVGDTGTTRLFSGEEVAKHDARPEACGDLDELVAVLGVARQFCRHDDCRDALRELQEQLFVVGAELATSATGLARLRRRVDADMVAALETRRARLEARVRLPRRFVVPGADIGSAHVDWARTVARRCERRVCGMAAAGLTDNGDLLVWLNRLSDFLWLLARLEAAAAGNASADS